MPDDFLGLNFKLIVAGCSGGLSIIYAMKKPEPWELIASLIVGGLTANYTAQFFFENVGSHIGSPLLMTGFAVGMGGKWLCLKLLSILKSHALSKD